MATALAHRDQQGVELIEQRRIGRQSLHGKPLHVVIRRTRPDQTVTAEDPLRVGIHHEHGLRACIQQDRVGRLGTDPRQLEQFLPQRSVGPSKHPCSAAAVATDVPACEAVEPFCLLAIRARWPNEPLKTRRPHCQQLPWCQGSSLSQAVKGLLHMMPRGGLRENGPHHHFKGGFRRPPVLRPKGSREPRVNLAQRYHLFYEWRAQATQCHARDKDRPITKPSTRSGTRGWRNGNTDVPSLTRCHASDDKSLYCRRFPVGEQAKKSPTPMAGVGEPIVRYPEGTVTSW